MRWRFMMSTMMGLGMGMGVWNAVHAADVPLWWVARGVINTQQVNNDFAPANVGQLKQVAYQTWAEVTNQLTQTATHLDAGNIVTGTLSASRLPTSGVWNASGLTISNLNMVVPNLAETDPLWTAVQTNHSTTAQANANYVNVVGDTMTGNLTIHSNLVVAGTIRRTLFSVKPMSDLQVWRKIAGMK